jgi:hypothetical protein
VEGHERELVAAEEAPQHVRRPRRRVEPEVEQAEQREEQPQVRREQRGRHPRQRGDREAPERDAEHEDRDDHREGVRRGSEGEAADADQDGLHRHHREALEERGRLVRAARARRPAFARDRRRCVRGCGRGRRAVERDVGRAAGEVQRRGEAQHAHQPELRHEPEARRERAGEGAGRVRGVHQRVEAGRVLDAARERLRQHRDRRSHQHGGRADQEGREQHVEREAGGADLVREAAGRRAHHREEGGEGEGEEPDPRLDRAVAREQPRRPSGRGGALADAPARGAEEPVAGREPAEEEREHGRRGLAVRAEQRREDALPGHLVGEPARPGDHREKQRRCAYSHARPPPVGPS